MIIRFLDPKEVENIRDAINNDAEFRIAARFFTNDVLFVAGDTKAIARFREGIMTEILLNPTFMDSWDFSIEASAESWEKFLQSPPPPFYNALFPGIIRRTFDVKGDLEKAFAHFWPITRMMDIMREIQNM